MVSNAEPASGAGTSFCTVMASRRLQRVQVLPAYRVHWSSSSWVTEKSTDSGVLIFRVASNLSPLNGPISGVLTRVLPSSL
ncbi:hypothetical protein D3C78_1742610 [compost metagenome]